MIIDDIALLSAKTLLENAGYTVTKKSELPLGYYKCTGCDGIFSGTHFCGGKSPKESPISYQASSHKEELWIR